MLEYITYRLPAHWSTALVNADRTGLTDDECHALDVWLANHSDEIGGACLSADDFDDFDRTPDLPEYAGPVMTYTFPRKVAINSALLQEVEAAVAELGIENRLGDALLECARWLVYAYRMGELEGGDVDWSHIDSAYEKAMEGLSHEQIAAVWAKAAKDADVEPDDEDGDDGEED